MKYLILVALVWGCAQAYSHQCNAGEKYWCKSLETAQQCNKFFHCIHVWKNDRQPVNEKSMNCFFCKIPVNHIQMLLRQGKSNRELTVHLTKSCASIRQQVGSKEICQDVSQTHLSQVIDMTLTGLKPSKICEVMNYCRANLGRIVHSVPSLIGNVRTQPHHQKPFLLVPAVPKPIRELPICDFCKMAIGKAKRMVITNLTVEIFEDFLANHICAPLTGHVKQMCIQVAKEFAPRIIELIKTELEPEWICQLIAACPSRLSSMQLNSIRQAVIEVSKAKKIHGVECSVCESIVSEARILIANKEDQQAIENFLKTALCSHLGSYAAQCQSYVDQYMPNIFTLLVSDLEPVAICRALGVCTTATHFSWTPHQDSSKSSTGVRAGPQCILCEFVMKEIDQIIGENRTTEAIEKALDDVCNILPSTVHTECVSFVQKYTPVIIQLLTNYLRPEFVCITLGLCPSASTPTVTKFHNVNTFKRPTAGSPQTCQVCTTTLNYIKALLTENTTETEVEQILEKICNFVPQKDRPVCTYVIERYAPQIIQLLLAKFDTNAICTTIGLCAASVAPPAPHRPSAPILGRNPCTWGPSYWCRSVSHATSCGQGALRHCQVRVWSKRSNWVRPGFLNVRRYGDGIL